MLQHRDFKTKITLTLILFAYFSFLALAVQSQDLPNKIRGYKVHKENILVQNESDKESEDKDLRVEMDFDEPELASVGLLGITLELNSKLTVFGQSGKIDFISFKDFKVNGIKVSIEEYRESFEFKKEKPFELIKPVQIFVSTSQTLRGAFNEVKDSKDKWLVTGRVFVFGKFKKFGFSFKRVIPVDIEIEIDNPVKEKTES
jgi:hypothetical protein